MVLEQHQEMEERIRCRRNSPTEIRLIGRTGKQKIRLLKKLSGICSATGAIGEV
jgi:hypothetical protein